MGVVRDLQLPSPNWTTGVAFKIRQREPTHPSKIQIQFSVNNFSELFQKGPSAKIPKYAAAQAQVSGLERSARIFLPKNFSPEITRSAAC